jgi:hypothetical protein
MPTWISEKLQAKGVAGISLKPASRRKRRDNAKDANKAKVKRQKKKQRTEFRG